MHHSNRSGAAAVALAALLGLCGHSHAGLEFTPGKTPPQPPAEPAGDAQSSSGAAVSGSISAGTTASGTTASGTTASGTTASGTTASGTTASGKTASGTIGNTSTAGRRTASSRYRSAQMQDVMQLRWEQDFGGAKTDLFTDVVSRRSDLVNVAVGSSMSLSSGRRDAWVVALDSDGATRWERSLGGARDDEARAVIDLPDGSVVIAGVSASEGAGGGAGLVARLDADGGLMWQTLVDTPGSDQFNAVTLLSSGDIVASGSTDRLQGLVARIDPAGKVLWQRQLSGDAPESVAALVPLPNDDLVLLGERTELFDSNAVITRINTAGEVIWATVAGDAGNNVIYDAVRTAGGDILAVGETDHDTQDTQGWLLKLDTDGNLLWQKQLGGGGADSLRGILLLADQTLMLAGLSDANTSSQKNSWIMRITEDGEVLRTKRFGSEYADGINAISPRSDGSFVAVGFSQSWHDEPRNGYIAMLGQPVVRSTTLNYATDDPPVVFIPGQGRLTTEKATVEVLGNVIHNKPISQLFVDGRPARVLHSGAFTARIPVPIGVTDVRVEAIDSRGAVGEATVQVTRTRTGSLYAEDLAPLMDQIQFGNYHAVVIGNDTYSSDIPQLQTAVKDATALAQLLERDYDFDVELLLNADRERILNSLERKSAQMREDDNLLVYYAGHGYYDEDVDLGYWLPVDADLDSKRNWIRNSTITDTIKAMKAKHVLLVADSCFSGTLLRSVDVKRTGKFYEQMANRSARLVMTSGGIEPVIDGGGDGHSVFARSFLDRLRSNEQILDGTSLFQAVREPVVMNSEQVPQYSNIRFIDSDGGDFLFVRNN